MSSKTTVDALKPTVFAFAMLLPMTSSQTWWLRRPDTAVNSARDMWLSLSLQVDELFQHLVRRRDRPCIGLKAALRDDHAAELRGQVHVRHLERAGDDGAAPAGARVADDRRARRGGLAILIGPDLHEAGGVREVRELDRVDRAGPSVGEEGGDRA